MSIDPKIFIFTLSIEQGKLIKDALRSYMNTLNENDRFTSDDYTEVRSMHIQLSEFIKKKEEIL